MDEISVKDIQKELFCLQDEPYRTFQSRLIPTLEPGRMIGVRTPALRKMAKAISKREDRDAFLRDLPHRYFEEDQLHAFVISEIRDFEECLSEVCRFLPFIDNWATCDQMSPRVFKTHKNELLPAIRKWLGTDSEYTVRFAIRMLMDHFLEEAFDRTYPEMVALSCSDAYYVHMMVAWYFATALAKQFDAILPFVEGPRFDHWTHRKIIQKALESHRITDEQKTYLRSLRRKTPGKKHLRSISTDGLEVIGRGAHGTIYRMSPDTKVKVFDKDVTFEEVDRERLLTRWAFARGVPTAIPFDTIRTGNGYGAVFEFLDVESSVRYIHKDPKNLADYARRSAALLRQIHEIEVRPGELPDMKTQMLLWAEDIREMFSDDVQENMIALIEEVPDRHTLLHGDSHIRNIRTAPDQMMFIDLETICAGHPVFELATLYNSYREFPSIDPEAAAFLGITKEEANALWEIALAEYGWEMRIDSSKQKLFELERNVQVLGCVRIIAYMKRMDHPAKEKVITRCAEDIRKALR